jgi:hypothetical protein
VGIEIYQDVQRSKTEENGCLRGPESRSERGRNWSDAKTIPELLAEMDELIGSVAYLLPLSQRGGQ